MNLTDVPMRVLQMRHGARIALTQHWWAWNHPLINAAWDAVFLESMAVLIEEALRKNRADNRKPRNAEELADYPWFRRDATHLKRALRKGGSATFQFRYSLSGILGIPLDRFYPSFHVAITELVQQLVGAEATKEDARLYARYREFASWDASADGQLDTQALAGINPDYENAVMTPANAAELVTRIAEQLGPILEQIDQELAQEGR